MADQVKFKKGSSTNLDSLPIENGSLIYTTDNNGLYVDTNSLRVALISPTGDDDTMEILFNADNLYAMSQATYYFSSYAMTSTNFPDTKICDIDELSWVKISLPYKYNKFIITNAAENVISCSYKGGSSYGSTPISPVVLGFNSPATAINYNNSKGGKVLVKTVNGELYAGLLGYSSNYGTSIYDFYIQIEALNPLFGQSLQQTIVNNITTS